MTSTGGPSGTENLVRHYLPWLTSEGSLEPTAHPRMVNLYDYGRSNLIHGLTALSAIARSQTQGNCGLLQFPLRDRRSGKYGPLRECDERLYGICNDLRVNSFFATPHIYPELYQSRQRWPAGIAAAQVTRAREVAQVILEISATLSDGDQGASVHDATGHHLRETDTVLTDLNINFDLRITSQEVEDDLRTWFKGLENDVEDDISSVYTYLAIRLEQTNVKAVPRPNVLATRLDQYLRMPSDDPDFMESSCGAEVLAKAIQCLSQDPESARLTIVDADGIELVFHDETAHQERVTLDLATAQEMRRLSQVVCSKLERLQAIQRRIQKDLAAIHLTPSS